MKNRFGEEEMTGQTLHKVVNGPKMGLESSIEPRHKSRASAATPNRNATLPLWRPTAAPHRDGAIAARSPAIDYYDFHHFISSLIPVLTSYFICVKVLCT